MKQHFFKRITLGTFLGCMAFSALPSLPSIAQMPVQVEANVIEDTISPCADVIYWRFRTLASGKVQRRRWNATKGYWVDPHWMDVN
ncbi:MAG: hypothetical protein Q4D60_01320 [Eubacteriales bacterium]|nr:hypothetical protein [Eubacteriales bacterium]